MSAAQRFRVMIVDDHPIMRDGLRDALDSEEDFEVVGQAADGAEAVRSAQSLQPDVIVMDAIMPNKNGVDACREIMDPAAGHAGADPDGLNRGGRDHRGGRRRRDGLPAQALRTRGARRCRSRRRKGPPAHTGPIHKEGLRDDSAARGDSPPAEP